MKAIISKIADVQAGPFGTQLHKDEYVDYGIPMLNAKNVGLGIVDLTSVEYVSQEVCDRLPRYVLQEGDIIFGRAGSIERHTYIDDKFAGAFQGTNCIRIRCHDKYMAKYLAYYLWTPSLKKRIELDAGGSTMSYLSTDILNDIEVNIPDESQMRNIANTLYLLDTKIAANNKINDNLAA
jgi:type I restriction enzyme S subunit